MGVVRNSVRVRQKEPFCHYIFGASTKWILSAVVASASQAGHSRVRLTKSIKILEQLLNQEAERQLGEGKAERVCAWGLENHEDGR